MRRKVTGSSIRALYKKAGLLRRNAPYGMKVTMLSGPSRGGYITRYEKNRRKVPAQLRGVGNVSKIKELPE